MRRYDSASVVFKKREDKLRLTLITVRRSQIVHCQNLEKRRQFNIQFNSVFLLMTFYCDEVSCYDLKVTQGTSCRQIL